MTRPHIVPVCLRACSSVFHRVQAADASLLVLACPNAVSFVTPSGPRLDIPAELAPLVTQNTFILLNKTDLLPTSAPAPATALTNALPQRTWAVSLASHAGTSDFLGGLAKALQDRCGPSLLPFRVFRDLGTDARPNRICSDLIHIPIAGIIFSKTLTARTRARPLSRTHGIAPIWNPRCSS